MNPKIVPWPLTDELIEGVAFATEADDGATFGPYCQLVTWEAAERWLYDQPGGDETVAGNGSECRGNSVEPNSTFADEQPNSANLP